MFRYFLLCFAICISIKIINAITYKKEYLEDYPESKSKEIKLGSSSESVVSLRCSRQKENSTHSKGNNSVVLSASEHKGIVISIQGIKFDNSCNTGESIKFKSSDKMFMICDRDFDPNIHVGMVFKSKNVTVNYVNKQNLTTYCDFTVTGFTSNPCSRNDFRCLNGICIWNELICDHRNNCGDNSDEMYALCRSNNNSNYWPFYFGIPALLCTFLLLFCCCVTRSVMLPPRFGREEVVYLYDRGYQQYPLVGGQAVMHPPQNVQRMVNQNTDQRIPNENEPSTSKQSSPKQDSESQNLTSNKATESNNEPEMSPKSSELNSTKSSKNSERRS